MEDVRAVLVDQEPFGRQPVIGVSADVIPLVDHQDAFVELRGYSLGEYASSESRANDEPVVHIRLLPAKPVFAIETYRSPGGARSRSSRPFGLPEHVLLPPQF